MDPKTNLANNLKARLKERGWTASELSRRAGVKKQTVSDWLNGRSPRNLIDLKKVATVLGIERGIDELLFDIEITIVNPGGEP